MYYSASLKEQGRQNEHIWSGLLDWFTGCGPDSPILLSHAEAAQSTRLGVSASPSLCWRPGGLELLVFSLCQQPQRSWFKYWQKNAKVTIEINLPGVKASRHKAKFPPFTWLCTRKCCLGYGSFRCTLSDEENPSQEWLVPCAPGDSISSQVDKQDSPSWKVQLLSSP